MAKNDKKEKKDSDPEFLLPKEEGAIEIPEPFEDNDSTIAMSGSDLEKAEALDPPEVEVDSFESGLGRMRKMGSKGCSMGHGDVDTRQRCLGRGSDRGPPARSVSASAVSDL